MALKSRLLWSERTIYHNSPPEIKISMDPFIQSFGTKIVSFGSCFALHMSTILEEQGFDAYFDVNNCQHFSPAGLMEKIEDIYLQKELEDADIYHHEKKGIKFSKRHTKLAISEVDAEAQLKSVSKQLNERAFHEIKDADLIVLTLGTATYIRDKTCGRIVTSANGMRQEDFTLHRATVSEVLLQLERIFTYLEKIASKHPKFVITLSPQRYGWLSISDRFPQANMVRHCLSPTTRQMESFTATQIKPSFALQFMSFLIIKVNGILSIFPPMKLLWMNSDQLKHFKTT